MTAMEDMATIGGRDCQPHRPAGNEQCRRAHGKDGCRAARANLDGPVADAVQQPDRPDASTVDRVDRHEGVQAERICEGCVERLGAGHVVLHQTVGREPDERHDELTGAGGSCHERGLERRPGATPRLCTSCS